jgi:hypothetical protein
MRRALVALAVLLAPLASARADLGIGPIPGEERFAGLVPQNTQTIGAGLGFGQINEDYFVQLNIKTELNLGPVGLGLQIPLNLRVIDRDPKNHGDYYGLVRKEDWDQKSEYLRVIRYIRLGHKRDTFYLRVGELAADLGHGTIVNHYLNNVDNNTLRVGGQFDVNTSYGGFETMISDFGAVYDTSNPRSRIVGTRVYFKPWSLIDSESFLNIFAIGASFVTDLNAPATYKLDTAGKPVVSNNTYEVDRTTNAQVWGLDLEAQVLHNALIDLIPYTDMNFISQAGWGWHIGVLTTLKLPVGINLTVPIRLEYRRFASDYVPGYFNTFYEVERFAYGIGSQIPKARAVRHPELVGNATAGAYSGYYGDLAFDFMGLVQVGAIYEARDGDPLSRNLQAFVTLPGIPVVQAKAYYARTGIQGTNDMFVFDDRSLLVAQARYEVVTYLYLVARFTRRWELNDTDKTYQSKDDWAAGLEFSMQL